MKKVMCTICLMLILLIAGCHGTSALVANSRNTHTLGTIPFMIPGWYLVGKCIEDLDAMMEAEREWNAETENAQRKNPVHYIEIEKGK